jgi:hypothetical protein
MLYPESTPASRYRSALAALEAQQSAINARKGTLPINGTSQEQAAWFAEHHAMMDNLDTLFTRCEELQREADFPSV